MTAQGKAAGLWLVCIGKGPNDADMRGLLSRCAPSPSMGMGRTYCFFLVKIPKSNR
jgi:hypothetical protein